MRPSAKNSGCGPCQASAIRSAWIERGFGARLVPFCPGMPSQPWQGTAMAGGRGSCRMIFGNHHGGSRGVAADHGRHDRGIDHAQAVEPAHLSSPSTTRASWCPCCRCRRDGRSCSPRAAPGIDAGIILQIVCNRLMSASLWRASAGFSPIRLGQAHSVAHADECLSRGCEIARIDGRGLPRVGTPDPDLAAAFGSQLGRN